MLNSSVQRFLLLFLFVFGCSEAHANYTYIPIYVQHGGDLPEDLDHTLRSHFGIGYEVAGNGMGAVTINLIDDCWSEGERTICGRYNLGHRCSPAVTAIRDSNVIAHEIGHAMGLAHDDKPENLMFPIKSEERQDTESWQRVVVHAGATVLIEDTECEAY